MKILVISVDRPREKWVLPGVEYYLTRVKRALSCEWETVRKSGKQQTREGLAQEGDRILRQVGQRDMLVLLDEKGRSMSSVSFSGWLEAAAGETSGKMIFCIGGAYGVADSVRERADDCISMSPMTFTHEMCLLFLFEQLYRADSIRRGTSYHH